MTITLPRITGLAGICSAVAGAIFIGVQINHPPADVAHIATTDLLIRESGKVVMAALAVAGISGMFLRNRSRLGAVGLVGYVLLSVGYLAMFASECLVGYVLPVVARTDPRYAQAVIDAAVGHHPQVDIGHVQQLFMLMGMGYAFGGLLFGIALFRAGILSRWATVLLAYGTVSALALSALPDSFNRPFAVPVGVALIGLGVSLWRNRDPEAATASSDVLLTGSQSRVPDPALV